MGCCGPSYKVNPEIDRAKNINELIAALESFKKRCNNEVSDIDSHLKKKTPLKTEYLQQADDKDLAYRVTYLRDLNKSNDELVMAMKNCKDVNYIYNIYLDSAY